MDTGTGTGVPHLLILEDDAAHRDLILRAFSNDPDKFRLSFAGTIRSAREILNRDRPDLILSDWILPDGKGLDILPRTDGFVTVPLIIMTSYGDERLAVEIMKSGAIDYVVKSAALFRDLPHIARRALADWENIQERKRAEAAAQDSRKRIADIMDFLPDAVLAVDNKGRVIGWNHAIERMTGVMAADMLGKGDHEYSIPFYGVRRPILIDLVLMDDAETGKLYDNVQRENGRITSESFIPGLFGGKGAYLWGTASSLFDSAGNRVGAIEVIRDITERKQSEETLAASEATQKTLLNAPEDTIALLDREGTIIDINAAGARRFGRLAAELTGRRVYDLLPPDIARERKARIDRVFGGGEPEKFDDERNGMILHNEIYPVFGSGGAAVDRVAIFARDITEEKKADLALLESERKYRFLIDNIRDIVWQTKPDLTFTYASPAAETLTGYQPGELIGTSLFAILTEPSAGIVHQRLEERMEEYSRGNRDLATIFEAEIRKKDGDRLWLEVSSNAIFGPDGTIAGFQGISRDITERKQAEEALTESEERLQLFIDHAPAALAMFDREMRYIAVSQRWMADYRIGDQKITGRSHYEIFPDLPESIKNLHRRGLAGEVIRSEEDRFERADGSVEWLSWEMRPWYTAEHFIGGIVIFSENITARKQAEEKLRGSEIRFRDLFNNMSAGVVIYQAAPDGEDFVIRDVNRSAEKIEHVQKGDIVGRSVLEVFPGVVEFGLFAVFQRVARTGIAEAHPVSMYQDNRISGWRENYVYQLPSGEIVAIYEDVTEKKQAEEKLRESEEKYHGLYDSMRDAFTSVDMGGRITLFNDTFQKMVGYDKEEIFTLTFNDLTPYKWHAIEADIIKNQVLTRGYSEIYEKEYRKKDGTVFPVELRTFLARDNTGNPQSMSAIVRDITERKRIEKELQNTEYQLSTIYRNISEVLFFLSVEQNDRYRFLTVNQPFLDITGLTRDQVIGRYVDEVIPEPSLTLVLGKYKQAILENTTSTWEEITEYPAGIKWGEVRVTPLFDAEGHCTNIVGSVHDITERKLAEVKLRESEERYRSVVENAAEGIAVAQDGMLQYANARLLEMAQLGPDEIAGRSFTGFIHPDDRALVLEGHQRRLAGENPAENYDFRILGKTGKIVWVQLSAVRIAWNGRPATLNFLMDITDRKHAEERLRESRQILEGILNSIPVRVFWKDKNLTYLGCNAPFAHDAGFENPGDIVGKDDYAMGWRDQAELYRSDDLGVIVSGNAKLMIEEPQTTPAGDTRYLLTSKLPLRDTRGDVIGVLGTYLDITDRKKAEEKLRESEERYRALLFGAGIGVGYWSTDGTLLFLNDISLKRLRGSEADFIGKNMRELFADRADLYLDRLQKAALSPDPMEYEDEIDLPVGKGWYLSVYTRICRPDGSVMGIQVLSMDITERKEAEEVRKAYETRLNAAMEIGSLAWWEMDLPDGSVRFDDRKAAMLGYVPDRFHRYQDFVELIHPDDYEPTMQAMRDHLGGGKARYFADYRIRTSGGEYRWLRDVGGITKRHPDGSPATVTGIVIDINPSKRADEALRESEERYRTLVEELPDFIIVHRNGELLYVNDAISRMLGKSAENLLHTSIIDYIAPESRETVVGAMEKRLTGIPVAPYTARLLLPDGSTRWVEIRGAGIMFDGTRASLNVLTDITEKKWAEDALYESEKKFRTVADYTYDWEYWVGTDGNFIYVSPSCDRISGYAPEDFYKDKDLLRRIVVDEDRGILASHDENLGTGTDSKPIEFHILTKDGRTVWIGHICQPVFSHEGEYLGRRGSNRDITERKQAEDALRASEIRFRSLIQNSSDIIRILDRDRRILYESASAERILGYPAGFFLGKDPGDYIHPDDLERVRADFSEVMDRKNSGVPTEFRIRNADGSYLWVDAVGTNLLGVPGVDGIVITIRPIQQRKMMENELRENQIRLATAMDMAHLVNWEFDMKTGIFTFNDRFYALYGTSADREGGYLMPAETYVREFVHPDDAAYAASVIGDVASVTDPDYSAELEHRIIRRDGEMRYIIVRFGVIIDETGTVTGTRGANQDITSRKMMESEIRSLNTVLEQRVDQRTNELNRSLQEKELLLREIHHRVKNNLQIIISILRLQKRQISDKATLATLMDSESRVRSMALVHEKLYRSKDIEHIDIGDYLKALTQYLFTTYTVEQRRIAFNVVMTDLSLDIQRAIPIGLILNELISNALKHAFPQGRKGEVRITGKKEDNRILIFIDDDGVGFPEGLDWRNTQSLGMHLVMTLIEQVRGTIDLSSGAGGTHFTISIPVQGGKGA